MQVMSTFDAGDHIKVKRPLYTHHGIYVNDCRVIDFSGGRNILEKPKALVQAERSRNSRESEAGPRRSSIRGSFSVVSAFGRARVGASARGGRATSGGSPPGCRHPGGLPAQRLNCEHIANWCKSGAHESKQVRYVHAGHTVISFGLLVALSRGPTKWRPALMVVALTSAVVTVYMQYEAWTTPRRWRPIIATVEARPSGVRPESRDDESSGN